MHASGIIGVILGGLLIGAIARLILPGQQPIGCLLTIFIGVVGAALGYWVGHTKLDLGDWPTLAIQILIAALLVAAFSGLTYRRGPPPV